ncbi:hypothetical protein [Mesorhizobium sp. SP-1A]|uniref:hypothetical protein n=1 Tax=Mesorhizobium sp. SP-1A TaxID=3077840 RepID=UPI0028F6CD34|nr:hypothetical protein [Mesorhizobium sp. SP-1A]
MRIRLPVPFRIDAVKKGCRNVDVIIAKSYETFEIKEISSLEAPVAITGLNITNEVLSRQPINETRWFENSNWMQEPYFQNFDPSDFAQKMDSSYSVGQCLKWYEGSKLSILTRNPFADLHPDSRCAYFALNGYGRVENAVPFKSEDYRSIANNDYEAQYDFYRKLCDEMILVDGQLYTKCPPPVHSVFHEDKALFDIGTSRVQDIVGNSTHLDVFSLNNTDILREHAAANRIREELINTNATVLIPEAADFPDEEYSLLNAADFMTRETTGKHLLCMTEEQGFSWFRLRTAFRKALDHPTQDAIENVADRIRDVVSEFEGSDLFVEHEAVKREILASVEHGASAIKRWDIRKIEIDMSPSM